ncbi:MAG: universal stress protein [Blastocatellia bacterium AA13]|nr:MAG: universal stress protein [Blastocatellia bacterium AA13]
MKILLAVDGSDCSEAAVKEAARRPWPEGSEIRVLSVIEPMVTPMAEAWALPDNYWEEADKAAKDHAGAVMDKALSRLTTARRPGLTITSETVRGNPRDAILNEAERWQADLIVVGSHGYSGMKKLWLGSVSQAVMSHAKCSVEIVRVRE